MSRSRDAEVGGTHRPSLAGYALARLEFAGKQVFTFVILAVMIIPAPAMFLAQYKLLIELGLTNNPVGYVLILITSGISMSTLIMRSFFVGQPKDLEEAAVLDGAGHCESSRTSSCRSRDQASPRSP